MTRVGHLFDATSGWQQRVGVQQLLKGLSKGYLTPTLILVDGSARRQLGELQNDAALVPRRTFALPTAPQLARVLAARNVAVIHAWGLRAAAAAAFTATLAARPLVLSWFEPQITDRQARLLRTIAEHARCAIACATATVRRRLVEKGIPPDCAVVIRPGVDFGMINQARRSDLRMRLGIQPQQRLLIAPEPATRAGGQFVLFWAAAIRSFLEANLRVLIPGDSAEQRRIARLARQIGFARHLICPGAGVPFEELVSVADVLVVASEGEVSTTAIAWAFGAGVPVIATAVHATAELVANRLNGLLLKPQPQTRMAAKIAAILEDRAALQSAVQTARTQAFEVFSVRRYGDQYARLYENLLAERRIDDGITDAAMSG